MSKQFKDRKFSQMLIDGQEDESFYMGAPLHIGGVNKSDSESWRTSKKRPYTFDLGWGNGDHLDCVWVTQFDQRLPRPANINSIEDMRKYLYPGR